jgi:hypothetical protein
MLKTYGKRDTKSAGSQVSKKIFEITGEYLHRNWSKGQRKVVGAANLMHRGHRSSEFRVEPETQNLKPIRPDLRLEPESATAFTRVGAADEGAGFWMNHDGVGATERFWIARDELMASALQFINR